MLQFAVRFHSQGWGLFGLVPGQYCSPLSISAARSFPVFLIQLVLHNMASRNATSIGTTMQSQKLPITNSNCSLPPSPACSGDGTDRWTFKNDAVSAVSLFCSNYHNLIGRDSKRCHGHIQSQLSLSSPSYRNPIHLVLFTVFSIAVAVNMMTWHAG